MPMGAHMGAAPAGASANGRCARRHCCPVVPLHAGTMPTRKRPTLQAAYLRANGRLPPLARRWPKAAPRWPKAPRGHYACAFGEPTRTTIVATHSRLLC